MKNSVLHLMMRVVLAGAWVWMATLSDALAGEATDIKVMSYKRHVRRMGEGGSEHIVSQSKTLQKNLPPYSRFSFSSQEYMDGMRERMSSLTNNTAGMVPEPRLYQSYTPVEPSVPPAPPPNRPSSSTPAPPVDPPALPVTVTFNIAPSGLDGETIARMRTRRDALVVLGRNPTDDALKADEIKSFLRTWDELGPLIFCAERRVNGGFLKRYQYGVNIGMRADVSERYSKLKLTSADRKVLAQDGSHLLTLRLMLDDPGTTDARRVAAQTRFNELLSKYFVLLSKAATTVEKTPGPDGTAKKP